MIIVSADVAAKALALTLEGKHASVLFCISANSLPGPSVFLPIVVGYTDCDLRTVVFLTLVAPIPLKARTRSPRS